MKKTILLLCCSWIISHGFGQVISNAEYFFDSDPGPGSGTPISMVSNAELDIDFSVAISNLSTGFHDLYIRVEQDNVWGHYGAKRTFYIESIENAAFDENITAAEYFFDADPGPGNGENINITAGSNQNVAFAADIGSLDPGFHELYIRVRQNNIWSHYGAKRTFYVEAIEDAEFDENITAAEYFFDSDPGPGNGQDISISPGADQNVAFTVPVDELDPGFHELYIRVKQNDSWGHYGAKRTFYVEAIEDAELDDDITTAEYFFDNDPGPGNGKAISINPGADQNVAFSVPVDELDPGFHELYIRVKQNDSWGHYGAKRTLYIEAIEDAEFDENITAAEYFFDNDPSPGNGEPISISQSANQNVSLSVDVEALGPGFHELYIRVKQNESWSHYGAKRTFFIDESKLTEIAPITSVEIFVDNDPGVGNGTLINVTPGLTVFEIIEFAATGIEAGLHLLYLRVIDENGAVSHYTTRPFAVCEGGQISPIFASTEIPDCENDEFTVELSMQADWAGPNYTLTNSLNNDAINVSAGDTLTFGPFTSGTVVSYVARPPDGALFCPAIFDATFTCYDCQELEVDNGDPCEVDGIPGEYVDCSCLVLDCAGVPGGDSYIDGCGVCDNISENDDTTCIALISGAFDTSGLCGQSELSIIIYDPVEEVFVKNILTELDESGSFSFEVLGPANLDIYIKLEGYLQKRIENVFVEANGSATLEPGPIIVGDFSGDNQVNGVDFSLFSSSFFSSSGSESYNQIFDLDCSGTINGIDFSLFSNNFFSEGDSPPD